MRAPLLLLLALALPAAPGGAAAQPAARASAPAAVELSLESVMAYLGAYQELTVATYESPALAARLARNGDDDAAWAQRIAETPALGEALRIWELTPAQYVATGRAFYDAWMTHVKLDGPGPRPGTPDPRALAFVRANAGTLAQYMGGLVLPRNVAPWPGGPLEQPTPGS